MDNFLSNKRKSCKRQKFIQCMVCPRTRGWGPPWQSSGYDSVLPVQGVQVQSLGGELGFYMPCRVAKKLKKKKKKKKELGDYIK